MLPIYTANTVIAMSDGWFRRPKGGVAGPSITLLRQYVTPQVPHNRVLFIARVAHREQVWLLYRQRQAKHSIGDLYPRKYYRVKHYTYTICSMSWSDHAITVLAEHATKSAAITALQQML